MEISIIGAGPIGGYTASLLAKKGHRVTIYEDHDKIGVPIQCTGLLTNSLKEVVKPREEYIVNKTKEIELIAPDNEKAYVKQKEYVINRTKFDRWFVDKAKEEGAKVKTGHRFTGKKDRKLFFAKKSHCTSDILIGADGANSKVASLINNQERKYIIGIQARVKGDFDPSMYAVYFGEKVSPGFFAWIVPESERVARVGLKGKTQDFERFLKTNNFEKIEMQAGPIPVYDPGYCTEKDNIFLVGDAATQVKATTGGGIIAGLKAAKCLAKAIETGGSYQGLWKRKIGRSLFLHLIIRRGLDKFSDKDWNGLIGILKQGRLRKALEDHDREHPGSIIFNSLLEWRLYRHLPKVMTSIWSF